MIITIGRKPFGGAVIDNVKDIHCGAINIDSCRIKFETNGARKTTKRTPRDDDAVWSDKNSGMKKENSLYADADPRGRFPANVIISKEVGVLLDKQSGVSISTGRIGNAQGVYSNQGRTGWGTGHEKGDSGFGDKGGASRYFFIVGGCDE